MSQFNYVEEVKSSIWNYFEDDKVAAAAVANGDTRIDEIREQLRDSDTVTGNLTGSFYCNAKKAGEAFGNSGLLFNQDFIDWLDGFGYTPGDIVGRGPEISDIFGRLYGLDCLGDDEILEIAELVNESVN